MNRENYGDQNNKSLIVDKHKTTGEKMPELISEQDKLHLGTKEIARRIREELKQTFKNVKFSVTYESYAGGSSISVCLMEADFKIMKDFKDISETALFRYEHNQHYTREQIKEMQSKDYYQLGHFGITESFDPDVWNNGVFLTERGHNLLRDVNDIILRYHFDKSDSQTDYYNVNFSYDMNIGKWDKPFKRYEQ